MHIDETVFCRCQPNINFKNLPWTVVEFASWNLSIQVYYGQFTESVRARRQDVQQFCPTWNNDTPEVVLLHSTDDEYADLKAMLGSCILSCTNTITLKM